ncbi:Pkinase-domain-containing protein [Punctularia strigosozonata HHB-11173 SS5]|uniref:Pkinase-domain-containing protein n=1 Tax=Punctularia strigosozonata (strain HHB-11173) TaxID=741275 RepID=UPI00044172B2|nr:Pkinase-domain-containing protein [Punctularia strigosozonata HHB-11173 SS5]EIN13124.1 Pkinase-domain-containing protein [Punctularia strigosozonata HHB-11173 SS5]
MSTTPAPAPAPAAANPQPVSRTSTLSTSASDSSSSVEPLSPSPPPTRPPTQPHSRANSTSSSIRPKIPWNLSGKSSKSKDGQLPPPSPALSAHAPSKSASRPPSRPPSLRSEEVGGGGQKFTLKDLLASGPKLARRSSQKSGGGSSRKSRESEDGESAGSLLKKYGVCGKVAIGKGATSVVRLAHKWDRSEEKLYAVKEFRKRRKNETEKEYVKKLTAEFCISSTLHHVNVVETVDLVQDENAHWCEVMEFCPGGDLYAAIKRGGMSPSEVECCFKQILTGVAYLHGQGVAHRDIKPENLFFDTKGHLKIGDYGASTVYRLPWEKTVHMSTGLCGSEPYIAPEQFLHKPYDARLVDIWACGIVYYCLLFQELPWRVAQPADPLYAAYAAACASGAPSPTTISNLSPRACRPLIRRMLEPEPKKRIVIEEAVQFPWVQEIRTCYDEERPGHIHVNAQALAQAQVTVV